MAVNMTGLTHVKDDLYELSPSLIKFAGVNGGKFQNHRHLSADRSINSAGFDPVDMDKIRNSIADDGLQNPPICRYVDKDGEKYVELLNGERRLRSILRLLKDKAKCYNPVNGSTEDAEKVFSTIQIRLRENIDDKIAFRIAWGGNENAVPVGEVANIEFVRYLRNLNYSDADICKITGMSVTWLREQDQLADLDDDTLNALASGQIIRSVALKLVQMPKSDRAKVLANLLECMKAKNDVVKASLEIAEETTSEEAEEAKAVAAAAVAEDDGTEESADVVAKATQKAEKATKKAEKARSQKQAYTTKPAKIRDLNEVIEADGGEVSKALSWNKIEKLWIEPLEQGLKSTDEVDFDRDYGRVAVAVLKAVQNGETDYLEVLASVDDADDVETKDEDDFSDE